MHGQRTSQLFPIVQYPDHSDSLVVLRPGCKYRIETKTGRQLMAGCNTAVAIKLVGNQGETNLWTLNKIRSIRSDRHRVFEANQQDEFIIVDKDIGTLLECELHMQPDGISKNSKWFLDHLKVQSLRELKLGI